MSTLSIRDLDLKGKRVFMRVDFNVPLAPGGKEITSDKRIKASLPSIQYALDHGHKNLRVVSDSELMVKQIQGLYKVKSPDLRPLREEARRRIAQLDRFQISHALRHKNKAADALANQAMDRGSTRP